MAWPYLILAGQAHSIPRVCPNCLRPGERPVRVGYRAGNMKYTQTFYYCDDCVRPVEIEQGYERRAHSRWLPIAMMTVGLLVVTIPMIGIAVNVFDGNSKLGAGFVLGGLFGGVIFGITMAVWFNRLLLRRGKAHYPKRDDQAVWGAAAYYAGEGYFAIRWDWLKLLGEANPECLSKEGRELIFGAAPEPPAN